VREGNTNRIEIRSVEMIVRFVFIVKEHAFAIESFCSRKLLHDKKPFTGFWSRSTTLNNNE